VRKLFGEMHRKGEEREKQEQDGASNVRAAQGDADGSRHALERSTEVKNI
jgi:hypothetical protein